MMTATARSAGVAPASSVAPSLANTRNWPLLSVLRSPEGAALAAFQVPETAYQRHSPPFALPGAMPTVFQGKRPRALRYWARQALACAAPSGKAPDFELVVLGRGLIGLGVSLCLMAGYKAHVQYFPLSRVQYANSLLLTAGSFGVMAAAWPVGWALEFTTWRVLLAGIAALVVVGSLVLFIVAPERVEPHAGASLASMAAGYKQIYASGRFWGPATTLGMVMGSFSAVQSLWLGTWLRDVALLDQRGVVAAITIIAFTSMIGYAVMGTFFDRLLRRGITAVTIYLVQGAVSIALFAAITFAPRVVGPVALWVVYGVLGAGGPIIYTIFAQQFPASLIGRVNTAGNLVVFALAFLFQWFVGLVLDLWPVVDGHYAPEGYRAGFAALLALQLVGYVVFVYGARHWLGRPRLTS